jgi:hypothetical protein
MLIGRSSGLKCRADLSFLFRYNFFGCLLVLQKYFQFYSAQRIYADGILIFQERVYSICLQFILRQCRLL